MPPTAENTLQLFRFAQDVDSFAAGSVIFESGQPGDLMYVVKEGEVDVIANGQVLETVGPGGILGEMALIDKNPRSATAVAKTDCQLARVSEQRFTYLVQQNPFFALAVMRIMAARLRHMDAKA